MSIKRLHRPLILPSGGEFSPLTAQILRDFVEGGLPLPGLPRTPADPLRRSILGLNPALPGDPA